MYDREDRHLSYHLDDDDSYYIDLIWGYGDGEPCCPREKSFMATNF